MAGFAYFFSENDAGNAFSNPLHPSYFIFIPPDQFPMFVFSSYFIFIAPDQFPVCARTCVIFTKMSISLKLQISPYCPYCFSQLQISLCMTFDNAPRIKILLVKLYTRNDAIIYVLVPTHLPLYILLCYAILFNISFPFFFNTGH